MKKRVLVLFLAIALPGFLFAETVRIGITGINEVTYHPSLSTAFSPLDSTTNAMRGLYWEVLLGRFGLGMTYLADTTQIDANNWSVDWNGSVDFRYHAFKRFVLDPFVEASFGSAGRVDGVTHEVSGVDHEVTSTGQVRALTIYGQIGAGVAVRLKPFHFGIKADYRFSNEPVVGSGYPVYPMKDFSAGIFGGLSF